MGENYYYEKEIFLKVKPADISEEVEKAKRDLPRVTEAADKARKLMNESSAISIDNLMTFIDVLTIEKNCKALAERSPISFTGMDRFWYLTFEKRLIVLNSIKRHAKDNIMMNGFTSLDEMLKEYRSLPDIIKNEPFIGRRLVFCPYYVLYDAGYAAITCTTDKKGDIEGLGIAIKTNPDVLPIVGEQVKSLNKPDKVYKLLYKYIDEGTIE